MYGDIVICREPWRNGEKNGMRDANRKHENKNKCANRRTKWSGMKVTSSLNQDKNSILIGFAEDNIVCKINC